MRYRAEIDGLRAIAITSVVLFHGGIGLFPGGYVGVDIFFAISGYLITSIIAAEAKNGEFSYVHFYARRARRILPAYFFVTFATTAVCAVAFLPADLVKYGNMLVYTTLFGANIKLSQGVGYFEDGLTQSPLLHMWSLSVEEQFYLVWPVLLLFLLRWQQGLRCKRVVLLLLSGSFILSIILTALLPQIAFYNLPSRGWELLAGAALALNLVPPLTSARHARLLSWTGLAFMALPVFVFDRTTPFPGFAAALPVAGCACVIHAASAYRTPVSWLLATRPFVFIGKISYSLYLWHWPLIAIPSYFLPRPLSALEAGCALTLSFVIAFISWRYVERPFRGRDIAPLPRPQAANQNWRARLGAAVSGWNPAAYKALALAAVFVCSGVYAEVSGGLRWRAAAFEATTAGKGPDFQLTAYCDKFSVSKTRLYECTWGEASKTVPVTVWGDSHADHYLPALVNVFPSGRLFMMASCPPVLMGKDTLFMQSAMRRCLRHNAEVFKRVQMERPALVVLAGRWSYRKSYGDRARGDFGGMLKVAAQGLTQRLNSAGVKVLILGQVPEQSNFWGRCEKLRQYLGVPYENCGRIERAEAERYLSPAVNAFAAAEGPGVGFYSPIDSFCDESYCAASKPALAIYRDTNHVNSEGALLMVDGIRAAAAKLVSREAPSATAELEVQSSLQK